MLEDLFVKGWVILEDPNVPLDSPAEYLAEKYLTMFPAFELIECTENFRVDESDRIVEWHNDSKFGMNITFLYYVDAMSHETGGSISLRNTDTLEEIQVYPKSHQLIIMSQKPNIEHRAEFCSVQRHMFNIDYKVKGF